MASPETIGAASMEPLWSPVVATSGNQRQIAWLQKAPKQAKTVAVRPPTLRGCRGLETIVGWLERAGFVDVAVEVRRRNKRLTLAEQEREVAHRYTFVSAAEVEAAVARMRADAATGDWVHPRPAHFIVGARP